MSKPKIQEITREEMIEKALIAIGESAPELKGRLGVERCREEIKYILHCMDLIKTFVIMALEPTSEEGLYCVLHHSPENIFSPYFTLALIGPQDFTCLLRAVPWFFQEGGEQNEKTEWFTICPPMAEIVRDALGMITLMREFYSNPN